jgi:hypothetical protein
MAKKLTPGTPTPKSGQYELVGPRGGRGPEITSTKGNPLPPTPKPNSGYVLVDATKHKSGK